MRRDQHIFGIASATRFALAAGQALVCWRREWTRDASQIRDLSRACDWVERLTRLSATLRDEPLFGRCLAELVEIPRNQEGAASAAHHAQPRRVAQPRATVTPPSPVSKTARSGQRRQTARGDSAALARGSEIWPARRNRLSTPSPAMEDDAGLPVNSGLDSAAKRHANPSTSQGFLPASSLNHQAAEVAELPQRAGRDLLESCANAQLQVHRRHDEPQAAAARPEIGRDGDALNEHQPYRRRAESPLHWNRPPVSMQKPAAFNSISERRSELYAEAESPGETFTQRLVRRTVARIRHLQPSANSETQVSEWLGEQWSTTLGGTAVSNDWLREIVADQMDAIRMRQSKDKLNPASPLATPRPDMRQSSEANSVSGANRLAEAGRSARQPEPAWLTHSPGNHDSETMRRARSLSNPPPGMEGDANVAGITELDSTVKRHTDTSPLHEFLPASFLNQPRLGDSFDDASGDAREPRLETASLSNAERLASPTLAPSLPALSPLPAAQTLVSGVLPLAAETARQGAREEANTTEDLDALAAKIKLILDEQARRHGIDV